jgi:HAD superfamily hydrolase (TIGR01509 family)
MKENIGFLFDLDGVLIDSETEYTRIWETIDELYPTGVANFSQVIKGTTLPNILSTYFREDIREEVFVKLHQMQQDMHFEYCPGAYEFLQELRRRNVKIAIVTSSDARKMELLWTQHPELKESVDVVIDAGMIKHSKPDPEGYLLAAAKLGLSPERCVVCEDAVQGIRAGKNAGATVIGFTATLGRDKIAAETDIVVDRISEIDIDSIIEKLTK